MSSIHADSRLFMLKGISGVVFMPTDSFSSDSPGETIMGKQFGASTNEKIELNSDALCRNSNRSILGQSESIAR
jgi:hypothetical protein